jgi:hypothetical protein
MAGDLALQSRVEALVEDPLPGVEVADAMAE